MRRDNGYLRYEFVFPDSLYVYIVCAWLGLLRMYIHVCLCTCVCMCVCVCVCVCACVCVCGFNKRLTINTNGVRSNGNVRTEVKHNTRQRVEYIHICAHRWLVGGRGFGDTGAGSNAENWAGATCISIAPLLIGYQLLLGYYIAGHPLPHSSIYT